MFIKRTLAKRFASAVLALFTLAAFICATAVNASAAGMSFTSDQEWQVLKLTNAERKKKGCIALSTFSEIDSAAKIRSDELLVQYSHTRPDGTSCFSVLDGKVKYFSAAENIAAGYNTPKNVVTAWMNSDGHRANILNTNYKHLGVGYTSKNSEYVHYWTQLFVGGCKTTGLSLYGKSLPLAYPIGTKIENQGLILAVECNMHGTSYIPLENASLTYDSSKYGQTQIKAVYDGMTVKIPVVFGFIDVPGDKWFAGPVEYVTNLGYFTGTSANTFSPNVKMNRAMFVTVIAKVAGADLSKYTTGVFKDVPKGSYYFQAANWAYKNGIVSGKGNGIFDPNASISRQEVCLMMTRYLEFKGLIPKAVDVGGKFADDSQIAAWARDAVYAIRSYGIISGKPGNLADPKGTASRAEVATMIMRLDEAQKNAYKLSVDNVDITIDGAKDSVRMLQISDIHLTVTDDTDSAEAKADQAARGAMFDTEITDGVPRTERFVQFVDYCNYVKADMMVLTGDIIDAPSNGNVRFVKENLIDKVADYLFVLGNHDWTGNWIGEYQSAYQREVNIPKFTDLIEDGEEELAVREYDGFTVVAIDNSNDQINGVQYAAVNRLIRSGTPFLLFLHVPVDSANSPSLASDTAAKWGRPITMGNPATNPTALTKQFVELLQSEKSTCRAIICGHIHMDHVDSISDKNDTTQYCLGASYEGNARVFDIHG